MTDLRRVYGTLLVCFNVCMGVLVGWAVSLATSCGHFDAEAYVHAVLAAHNCTAPFLPTDCDCPALQRQALREGFDRSLRACFAYCETGLWCGLALTVLEGCLYGVVQQAPGWRQWCQRTLGPRVQGCWATLQRFYQRWVTVSSTSSHPLLPPLNLPLLVTLTPTSPLVPPSSPLHLLDSPLTPPPLFEPLAPPLQYEPPPPPVLDPRL